jgi:hypothetical protein
MIEKKRHGLIAGVAGLMALVGGNVPVFAQTLATGGDIRLTAVVAPANEGSKLEVVRPLTASQGVASVAILPGSVSGGASAMNLPQVFAPTKPRTRYTRYPWKTDIMTTVFWVGELPTPRNPTPNTKSAWDREWVKSFGGYDDPDLDARSGFLPKKFEPGQNPFYIALPYNDLQRGGGTKTSARHVIPWYDREFESAGKTIIKGRWLAIRRGAKVCYAQWEDVGPFETDDWRYVFGDARPKTKGNKGAGLDVSPAVRDYLGMTTMGHCDWRFVDVEEVPDGPWKRWGENNPFSKAGGSPGKGSPIDADRILKVREMADQFLDGTAQADNDTVAAE